MHLTLYSWMGVALAVANYETSRPNPPGPYARPVDQEDVAAAGLELSADALVFL